MSIVLQSSGGGSVTLQEPSTASNVTVTIPAATGEVMVTGNMPAFSAIKNSGSQSLTSGTATKITFDTEFFDTNNNFASSRFTPTVAGYYQITSSMSSSGSTALTRILLLLWKNGAEYSTFQDLNSTGVRVSGSQLVYLNGTTDYVEIYGLLIGTGPLVEGSYSGNTGYNTTFSGAMVRGA